MDQRYVYFDTFSRHVQNFKGIFAVRLTFFSFLLWISLILNCDLGVTVYTPTATLNQSNVGKLIIYRQYFTISNVIFSPYQNCVYYLVIMFQSGAGVEVVENNRHMTARVYLPITFMVSLAHNTTNVAFILLLWFG